MAKTVVGKFVLDSLTLGMYDDKKIIYREYVQNSTDGIESALKLHWLNDISESYINICIDAKNRRVTIKDNGSGIPKELAFATLKNIGDSNKDYKTNRGFRGIGRLAGTAYCDTLIFITSSKGENEKSILTWDCVKLKEMLKPGKYKDMDLIQVIDECTEEYTEEESLESHFFEVIMEGIDENSELLNEEKVINYLSEVAPIDMNSAKFYFYQDNKIGIKRYLKEHNINIDNFPIRVNYKDLTKLYKVSIEDDKIAMIKNGIIEREGKYLAYWWYGVRKQNTGVIKDNRIAGIRYRLRNIQIGDSNTCSKLFSQDRFNKYYIGEIHILDNTIVPNARRDYFEESESLTYIEKMFIKDVTNSLTTLTNTCSALKKINNSINQCVKECEKIENESKSERLTNKKREEFIEKMEKNKGVLEKNKRERENKKNKIKSLGFDDLVFEEDEIKDDDKILKIEEKIKDEEFKGNQINELTGLHRNVQKAMRKVFEVLKLELDEETFEKLKNEIIEKIKK